MVKELEELIINVSLFIVQNGMFDIAILTEVFRIYPKGQIFDTMIAMGILYPELEKGLEFLASLFTNEPPYKKGIDTIAVMNAKDSAITFEVGLRLAGMLQNNDKRRKVYDFSVSLFEPLLGMSMRGVKCDMEKREELKGIVTTKMIETKEKFCTVTESPTDFNLNSPTQIKELFYKRYRIKPQISRKTNKETVDEDALLAISKKNKQYSDIITLILDYRKFSKLNSTYINMPLCEENRFHSSYNIVGTETGRLSSSKYFYVGGNLQNIPRPGDVSAEGAINIRSMFIADPGMTLVEMDLEQAEARVVAWLAQDPFMMRSFNEGKDIHKEAASLIFEKPVDEVEKIERYLAKRLVHAYNYDVGVRTMRNHLLKEGFDIPEGVIRKVFAAIDRNFPNIARWKEGIRARINRGEREFETPLGRQSLFLDRTGESLYRQAYAFVPQSTVGHLLNIILRRTYEEVKAITLLLQCHDSFVFEIETEKVDWAVNRILPIFDVPLRIHNNELTIPVGVKQGQNWGEMVDWEKAA